MDLEVATVEDMVEELKVRNLVFMVVAVEHLEDAERATRTMGGFAGREVEDVERLLITAHELFGSIVDGTADGKDGFKYRVEDIPNPHVQDDDDPPKQKPK